MRLNERRVISYLIVFVPLILVLSVSFFISTFYINKVTDYFNKAKQNSIKEYIRIKKNESEMWNNQLILLFKYTDNRYVDKEKAKEELVEMIKSIPLKKDQFLSLYEYNKELYNPKSIKIDSLDDIYFCYSSSYFKPFGWKLVYGFKLDEVYKQTLLKQERLQKMLDRELSFIIKVTSLIVCIVVLLSLFLSLKINKIFTNYQDEVQKRTDELEALNDSLEHKVQEQLDIQRQKDKILVQRSKMAEMGEMLSMIAHQWRQPLNQLTYIFMNIESAYEYNELTPKYLEKKVKEGNDQLEYMSSTIDEFRSFFKPDKQKEMANVDELIKSALSLMKASLKAHSIEIKLNLNVDKGSEVYKNEFKQVLLNIIKNAKDMLVLREVQNPQISISSYIKDDKIVVDICDNAKGIDEKYIDKIFEPYFSTKDEKNGTGLGLYMSKTIISEHHNGDISVKNTKQGCCFSILF